jgi:proteasome lid subunit RPN8/RPN11
MMAPGVLEAIQSHVTADVAQPAGGILLGRREASALTIMLALPDEGAGRHDGEMAFSAGIWRDVYAAMGQGLASARVLGWYHSHPRGDLRLSAYDRALHTAMFGDPFMVALVMDPLRQKKAWYGWTIERLVEEVGEPKAVNPPVPSAPARVSRRLVAGAAAVVLAAGLAGWGVGALTGHHRGGNAAAPQNTTPRDVAALRQEARRLQGELNIDRARASLAESDLRSATAALARTRQQLQQVRERIQSQAIVLNYRVRPGDTMWDLAARFYGSGFAWPRIAGANHIENLNVLFPGQIVRIPLGSGG